MAIRKKQPLPIIFILTLILLIAMLVLLESRKNQVVSEQTIPFTISGTTYRLLMADNEAEWERGLMFITKKEGYDGMLFEFGEAKPRTFWNKNTLVDLTVYWFAGEELVGKSELPSIKKSGTIVYISSPKPVDKVVEIIKTNEK